MFREVARSASHGSTFEALNVEMLLVLADSACLKPANTSEGIAPSAEWLAHSMSLRIGMQACRPTGHVSLARRKWNCLSHSHRYMLAFAE